VHIFSFRILAAFAAAFLALPVDAATSVTLPALVCAPPGTVFVDKFDAGSTVLQDPSNGNGGLFPGKQSRNVHVAYLGTGTQTYYLYLPSDYTPMRSWPLLLVLHGVAPYGSQNNYASTTRDNWIAAATAGHFIVAAPVANEIYYDNNFQPYAVSWLVPPTSGPSDYDMFAAIRADLESAYNIERTRIYGWGFSAGAHVMHDLAINTYSAAFNASTMAAYGVSAGVLQGLACPGPTDAGCAPLLAGLPRRIPVDIHIGTSDPNYAQAVADHALFLTQGWTDVQTIHYVEFSGGHTYTIAQLSTIWNNLCPNAVTP
jgi:predicted esterase